MVLGNTLQYAYKSSLELGRLPILGSIVRAVGKEWRVCVVTSGKEKSIFLDFQKLLKNKDLLTVLSLDEVMNTDFSDFDLLLLFDINTDRIPQIRNSKKVHVMAVEKSPSDEYDLISDFTESNVNADGVTAITGNGKGKTTSALGLAVPVLLKGEKVAVIQWFKERKQGDLTWAINEHQFPAQLLDSNLMEFHPTGLGFFGSPKLDRVKGEQAYQQHRQKAYEGLEIASHAINSGKYGMIILDELIDTVSEIALNLQYPLIDLEDLQKFLSDALEKEIPLVVTGRRVTDDWSQFIKRSIVITEIKHPWSSKHQGAISGLDF